MNVLALVLVHLVACGGGSEAPAPAPAPAAPAPAAAPAPSASSSAPAEEVGPDGPSDLAIPTIAEISTDPALATEGEKVWNTRGCGGCHQFGAKLVGPDLVGVTQRRSIAWISRMVLHPDVMIKRDPVAKDLFKTHMTPMPKQGVTDEELPKLLAYVKSKGG